MFINITTFEKHWFNKNDNRNFITTIIRIKSKYTKCPSHLKEIDVIKNSVCTCGEEVTMNI